MHIPKSCLVNRSIAWLHPEMLLRRWTRRPRLCREHRRDCGRRTALLKKSRSSSSTGGSNTERQIQTETLPGPGTRLPGMGWRRRRVPRKYSYASLCRMDYIMVLPGFKGVSTFRTCALRVKGNLGGHPGIRQSRGQEQHDPSRDAAPIPIRMRRRTTRESARAGCIHPRLSP
jgi:hypothetical protein